MKKITALLLVIIMLFSAVFGCTVSFAENGADDIFIDEISLSGNTYIETSKLLYTANSVKSFVQNNPGTLPSYVTLDNQKIYMPELCGLFAQQLVYLQKGESAFAARNEISTNASEYEKLISGELSNQEYTQLAYDVIHYINIKGEAPGYITTSLGELSFGTIITVFSNVLAAYKTSGKLLQSVEVSAWASPLPAPPAAGALELSTDNILSVAKSVNSFISNNNDCPTYVTIEGQQVYMPELLVLFARVIADSYDNVLSSTVLRSNAAYFETSYEAITSNVIVMSQYAEAAKAVISHVENSVSASAPGFVQTDIGAISCKNLIKIFAYACACLENNGYLPASIIVGAWSTALPTPPEATEAPEYQYLNFFNVVKAANRVLKTIENIQGMPGYVTLDNNSKVYQGTMLRLFAATVSNINRGKSTDMPLQEIATPKGVADETLTAGVFTKDAYIKLATRIATAIYTNGAIPTYITTELGTMNHYNMIYLFSRVLDFYLTHGFLPDSISVAPWGTFPQ